MRFGRISQICSRPSRVLLTSPASARMCRCLVMAWRVTLAPWLRRTMDCGPLLHRRTTSSSRVSSPSAAKTGAASRSFTAADERDFAMVALLARARGARQVLGNQLRLRLPALLVGGEGLQAALERDAIEARLGDGELRPVRSFLQLEGHQRRRLLRVVEVRFYCERMPAERNEPRGLDSFHGPLERLARVWLLGLGDLRVDFGGRD